jgi:predicted Holliday junction resolvase-like endonuclease
MIDIILSILIFLLFLVILLIRYAFQVLSKTINSQRVRIGQLEADSEAFRIRFNHHEMLIRKLNQDLNDQQQLFFLKKT